MTFTPPIKSTYLLVLLCTIFVSCEDKIEKCSDQFISDHKSLEGNFIIVYSSKTTHNEFQGFRSEVKSFVRTYPDKCKTNGNTVDVNSKLESFLSNTEEKMIISPEVIYGDDDRQDVESSSNENYKKWSESVAVQISSSKIGVNGELPNETIGESMSLCKSERFRDQINPGRCSGFLVGEDILVTAGHCVQNQGECDNFSWVFGFKKGVSKVSSENIYKCSTILSQKLDDETNADYAVIKLERVVTNRRPLKFRTKGAISNKAPIVVIGHPSGLPMKVAAGANVRTNSDSWFFVGNLDTFGGNSGSPVLNDSTGIVEGILVRGENDYNWEQEPDGGYCRVTNRCKDSACRGEDVTRITKVDSLPEVLDSEDIFDAIFKSQAKAKRVFGTAFPTYSREDSNLYLAGLSFLSKCAVHYATQDKPNEWIDSKVTDCSKNKTQITDIINNYLEQF
jgi:V8-like Glu-specific endopeptidase